MNSRARQVSIGFRLACWLGLLTSVALATKPAAITLDNLDARLEFLLPDTIVVGDSFLVTFNVTICQPIVHRNEVPDRIIIKLPPCCKLDSGIVEWTGYLDDSLSVSLNIRARAVHECIDFFEAAILAGCLPYRSNDYSIRGRSRSREYHILSPRDQDSSLPKQAPAGFEIYEGAEVHPRLHLLGFHIDTTDPLLPLQYRTLRSWTTHVLTLDSLRTGRATIVFNNDFENRLLVVKNSGTSSAIAEPVAAVICRSATTGLDASEYQDHCFKLLLAREINEGTLSLEINGSSYPVVVKREN